MAQDAPRSKTPLTSEGAAAHGNDSGYCGASPEVFTTPAHFSMSFRK